MATITTEKHVCDKCGEPLGCNNHLNIVTSLSENRCWSRLHVKVEYVEGIHNDGKSRNADLCQRCAKALLNDAFERVTKGERVSAGVEHAEAGGWE